MAGKFTTANGVTLSQSRQFLKCLFGGFLVKVDKNDEKKRFDIYLQDKIIVKLKGGEKRVALLKDASIIINGVAVNIYEYIKSYYNDYDYSPNGVSKKEGYWNFIVYKKEN